MTIKVRGHCPGALAPMQTGDGLLVRIKPHSNLLSASQCIAIGHLANTYGNGSLDVTRRANLQLRGIQPADYDAVIAGLREHDLVDDTAAAESLRNILVSPLAGVEGEQLARSLAATLSTLDLTLPGKFGFAVDTGMQRVLHNESADIRIERAADHSLIVRADGTPFGTMVTEQNAVATVVALAEWFVAKSSALPTPVQRMASLIQHQQLPDGTLQGSCAPADCKDLPVPGALCDEGLYVGAEFGQISAATLTALASFAPVMLTPWRLLLLKHPDALRKDMNPLHAKLGQLDDLITEDNDPRFFIVACTGAPACQQALQSTRPLARELAKAMQNTLSRLNTLHVSGCGKGCASHQAFNLTLVGTHHGFDAISNGSVFATPDFHALTANSSAIVARMTVTSSHKQCPAGTLQSLSKPSQANH